MVVGASAPKLTVDASRRGVWRELATDEAFENCESRPLTAVFEVVGNVASLVQGWCRWRDRCLPIKDRGELYGVPIMKVSQRLNSCVLRSDSHGSLRISGMT